MSLADVTFINMCKDVIENGTSTQNVVLMSVSVWESFPHILQKPHAKQIRTSKYITKKTENLFLRSLEDMSIKEIRFS